MLFDHYYRFASSGLRYFDSRSEQMLLNTSASRCDASSAHMTKKSSNLRRLIQSDRQVVFRKSLYTADPV